MGYFKCQQKEATSVAVWADSNLPDRDGHKAQRGHVGYGIHRGSYCGGSQGGYHQCNKNQNLRFILDFCVVKVQNVNQMQVHQSQLG